MANEVELQIVLKLLDQATGDIKNAMGRIKEDAKGVGQEGGKAGDTIKDKFKQAGKELKDFRRTMFIVTAAVSAMIMSIREAAKYNDNTRKTFDEFTRVVSSFVGVIGTALAPALRVVTFLLTKIRDLIEAIIGGIAFFLAADWSLIKSAITGNLLNPTLAWKKAVEDGNNAMNKVLMDMETTRSRAEGGTLLDFKVPDEKESRKLNQIIDQMGRNVSSFASDFITSIGSAKDAFADFGMSMVRTFTSAMVEIVTQWIWMKSITGLGNLFGSYKGGPATPTGDGNFRTPEGMFFYGGEAPSTGGFSASSTGIYHQGGIIRAHNGLALDEVPIIAKSGERVLSREQNRDYENGGKGGLTINVNPVIQLWDASDVSRNNRTLVNAINEAIINNQAIRRVIRDYA